MNNLVTYLITLVVGFCAGATCFYLLLWYKKIYADKLKQCGDYLNDEAVSVVNPISSQKKYAEETNSVLNVTLYDKTLSATRRKKNKLHLETEER
jgi:hypothetical protein